MNNLRRNTITSMEVAEMVGKEHSKLLRDIRNYVAQLGEAKIGFTDFFKEATYTTEQNKILPCFQVTKKGCEFIAHKLTGQKGTEFTARYINRFHEMEDGKLPCPLNPIIASSVAELDVVVSAGKQYIGQYTDYDTPDDSIDPTKYRWTKIKGEQGEKGEQGVPGRTYFIELSSNILKRGQNDKVVPSTITAKAYYRDGDSAARTAYSGRWYVQTSTDGSTFTNALVSTVNEPSKSYTVSSLDRSIVSVRFILYAADGTTNQLDMQSVPVVIDVDALTHEEIFNLLTNNGFIKGVYKEGNQLYFSFTYAKGGTLKLGGPNNGYGTFEVYDANGNIITQIDNSVGFKNFKGKEWFQINESVATAGYDSSLVHGLLDLSAQYSDGYWTVLESKQAGLLLKTVSRMKVETTGSSSLTLNVPEMPKLITGSNLGKNSNGDVGTIASSSMRYKILWKAVKEDELEELYRIKVIWAKYKDGYLMEQDERCGKEMPMFIAEDIERRFPIAVDHDEKGRAENWNYRIMIPCMFAMLKNEHEKVKDLQSEFDSVKAELEELKQLIEQHISTEV